MRGRVAARIALAGAVIAAGLAGCGGGDVEKFRSRLAPVVGQVSGRLADAASLGGAEPAQVMERSRAQLTDLAGLGADLKALQADGEKQRALAAAGSDYLAATQAFVKAQQEFAGVRARLDAARAKVRESLEAKQRTSKFSLDFWKETHDRLVNDFDKVRTEAMQARARLAAVGASTQQAVEAARAALGADAVVPASTLGDHARALDALPLEKGV